MKKRKAYSRISVYVAALFGLTALLLKGPATATTFASDGTPLESNLVSIPQQQRQGPADPAELEAFLDALMAKDMAENHIAGAAVAVVKDGRLFFAKGYGYADVGNGTPVDPEQTIFKIASTTKTFTWTAVMQLVEQGKLDLDADINTYLDFAIPDTYPEPITLKDLMTHTSGFEESYYEILARDSSELVPAGEWLTSHLPERVRPPGAYAGYSNHNTFLAGYIVAQVAGVPYEQYIQENILDPLGMAHASAQNPLPPELNQYQSKSYTFKDGVFQIFPETGYLAQIGAVPGEGMAASATDMARFMIAHLQNGFFSDENIAGVRILEEATAQQMHSTLFTPDPRILGTAHGFFDFSDNGQWTIGHGGGAAFGEMNNAMLLLPDQNLGLFYIYNSTGSDLLTLQHLGFMRSFYNHYYPTPAVAPIDPPADFAERAARFTGSYRITQSAYTSLQKTLAPFIASAAISDPGDGTLLLSIGGLEFSFVEVDPLFFRQVDGPWDMAFREDEQGRITLMFSSIAPQWSFEKLNWYETLGFTMVLILACALIFLSVLIVAFIGFVRGRRLGNGQEQAPRRTRQAKRVAVGISLLNLLFLVFSIGTIFMGSPVPFFGVSLVYRLVLVMALLAALLTLGAIFYTVMAWKDGYWGSAWRAYYTLFTIAAVAFVWFLNIWNLLGWQF